MRKPILCLAMLAALASGAPLRAQVVAGRIEGTVVLSRALAARRLRFRVYKEPGQGATPPSTPAAELRDEFANVVVYLELDASKSLARSNDPHTAKPAMTQRGEQFTPHVLAVMQGATIDFPNADDVFHNVFSLSAPRTFDLPKYPAGESRSEVFNRAGVVNVFCHIHADMSAVILVRDNPYFVSPDTAGHYSLDGVPPGEYTLVVWHERIKPVKRRIRVIAGQATMASFDIPLPAPPEKTDPSLRPG
jgi:plastocyanin